uniref:AMP-dependent synthetase/ligase domain-containing protein n=1 Tax=Anopheles farauti TaxID=69004 RepID=A0A182QAB0_9DIPT
MTTVYDGVRRCWSGPVRTPVLNPAANLGPVLLNVLERTPGKPAQVDADHDTTMTCEELRKRAIRFATLLGTWNYRPGDVVALIGRNSANVAPVAFGCFIAGVTLSTLDPSFAVAEVEHILRLTRPRCVLSDWDALEMVRQAAGTIGLTFDRPYGVLIGPEAVPDDCFLVETVLERATPDPEDGYVPQEWGDSTQLTAAIVCSSGTTGLPKAVRISHAQLIAPFQRVTQLDRDDTIFCFSTLYWISGLQMLMTGTLNGVRRVITARRSTPALAIEMCQRYRVTLLLVTPSMASDIVRTLPPTERLESVRLFAIGGATVPVHLCTEIETRVLVAGRGRTFVGYGTSETGNIAYQLVPRKDSVGFLLPNITAQVVNEDGLHVGPNELGELIVRSPYPFLGYQGNTEATRAFLTADGFMRTGDIVRFDNDGFLFLHDRKREIFKYDGYQIAPATLEARISELPGVRYVVVVGMPEPNQPYNGLATALIVRDSTVSPETLTERTVIEHCDDPLRHKRLQGGAFFVPELPMTASGKIQREAARRLARQLFEARCGKH